VRAWIELYRSHREGRTCVAKTWARDIRRLLTQLADAGHCDGSIRGRFTVDHDGKVEEWAIRRDGKEAGEPLTGLPDLETAEISVMGTSDTRGHLHAFTIAVEGRRRDGSGWSLAVDLPDDRETAKRRDGDRQGLGACGHAAFHCHVGPDRKTAPEVRVPLPSLAPGEVLEWVLSQIIPTRAFEPAPWAAVQEALKKKAH
jgi:hypothetical protein